MFWSLVGVKQWEPLSLLLFILFLNELTHELDIEGNNDAIWDEFQKFVLLFADDNLLLFETLHDFQGLLNKLSAYCAKWNLTVNTNKTKIFRCCIFFICLGVNVTSNGNFSQAQNHLSEQASKALYSLSHVEGNELCISDKLKLFDSLVSQ